MSAFRDGFPIVYTPDVERALRFYRDALGFAELYRWTGEDGTLEFVSIALPDGTTKVGLTRNERTGEAFVLWLYTDDVDAQVERLRASEVPVLQEPEDMPWGERLAFVADPDGNRIAIGATAT
jgi:lactoylglutathione lyase